jgi:hypothetical protein
MKVSASPMLEPGLDIVVATEGLPYRASRVQWMDDSHAGIAFNRVMPLDSITYWAAQQQPREQLADLIALARGPVSSH